MTHVRLSVLAVGFVLVLTLVFLTPLPAPRKGPPPAAMLASTLPTEAATGAGFTENLGQVANRLVSLYFDGGTVLVGFGPSEVFYVVRRTATVSSGVLVLMTFPGSRRVEPVRGDILPYRSHFFLGSDPAAWRTDVPSYAEVRYPGLYDGVDLVFRAGPTGIEYEFQVLAGADPSRIMASYEGASGIRLADDGSLVVSTTSGDLTDGAPRALQGDRIWPCSFEPNGFVVGFHCDVPDPSQGFVIDPLLYATYLGGSGSDAATSIAAGAGGSAYITGIAGAADFPTTPGAYNRSFQGGCAPYGCGDAFVLELNDTGSALVYATFLGGTGYDIARGIRVDGLGAVYVTGNTSSPNFPTTGGAYDTTYGGGSDAFVAKLSPTGSGLDYSTYLGGSGMDVAYGIAIDSAHDAYLTGLTESSGFPTTSGAYNRTYADPAAFVTKVSPDGRSLVYSTLLGSTYTGGAAIALDGSGNAYVTGATAFAWYPTIAGAFSRTLVSNQVFVTKLNAAGSNLVYSTFVGGNRWDLGYGIAVDSTGDAFVTGFTNSTDFPTTAGAFNTTQTSISKGGIGFVTKLNPAGSALVYSTYLGGTWDYVNAITLDANGNAFVTGETGSGFPVTPGVLQGTFKGTLSDAFVAELNVAGSAYVGATYLGGTDRDVGTAIALGPAGGVYVVGTTSSADFPVYPYGYDQTLGGFSDAFAVALTSFTGQLTYRTTLDTSPSGLQVLVNGTAHAAPYTFFCTSGDSLALNVTSPQLVNSTPYEFQSWSDGGVQGHTVGCSGPMTYTATFAVSSAPDFVLVVNPTESAVSWYVGDYTNYYVTVIGLNGYAGPSVNVTLTASDAGITGTCMPQSLVVPTGTCRMSVHVSSLVNTGVYTLLFHGSNGTVTHSAAALLDVFALTPPTAYFVMEASPENLTVPAGESATTTVWINWSETTSYLVSLTVAYPAGVGVALRPSQVEGNGTATVTFVIDGSVAPGTYPAWVYGSFGTTGLTQAVRLNLIVTPGRLTPTSDSLAWSVAAVGILWAVIATILIVAERRRRPGPPPEPPE